MGLPDTTELVEVAGNGRFEGGSRDVVVSVGGSTDDPVVAKIESKGKSLSVGRPNSSGTERSKAAKKSKRGVKVGEDADEVESSKGTKRSKSKVAFGDAFGPGTELSYEASTEAVKESIVLSKAPKKAPVFRFPITAPGLTARPIDDGFEFVNDNGTVVFRIPASFMFDSRGGADTPGNAYVGVKQELVTDAEGTVLVLSPSLGWLTSKDRVYPVTIDPTVSMAPWNPMNLGYSQWGDNSNGATFSAMTNDMQFGNWWGSNWRSYVQFDPAVFTGRTITKATLKLAVTSCDNQTNSAARYANAIGVHKLTSVYFFGQTWALQPSWSGEVWAGVTGPSSIATVDVTAMAQGWAATPSSNFGVMLDMGTAQGFCKVQRTASDGRATEVVVEYMDTVQAPSVVVSPGSVANGAQFTATYANLVPTAGTWMAIYRQGESGAAFLTPLAAPGSSGTLTFTAPAIAGTYVARLFANSAYTVAAETAFAVTANGPSIGSIYDGNNFLPGWSPVPVTAAGLDATKRYWIGQYPLSGAFGSYVTWQWVPANATSVSLTFTAPTAVGNYEYRLYVDGQNTPAAVSRQFQVIPNTTTTAAPVTTVAPSGPIKQGGSIPTLIANDTIYANSFLESDQGHLRMYMQGDGNVTVQRWTHNVNGLWTGQVVWGLNSVCGCTLVGGSRLQMHPNGNLILWPPSGSAVWQTNVGDRTGYNMQLRLWDPGQGTVAPATTTTRPPGFSKPLRDGIETTLDGSMTGLCLVVDGVDSHYSDRGCSVFVPRRTGVGWSMTEVFSGSCLTAGTSLSFAPCTAFPSANQIWFDDSPNGPAESYPDSYNEFPLYVTVQNSRTCVTGGSAQLDGDAVTLATCSSPVGVPQLWGDADKGTTTSTRPGTTTTKATKNTANNKLSILTRCAASYIKTNPPAGWDRSSSATKCGVPMIFAPTGFGGTNDIQPQGDHIKTAQVAGAEALLHYKSGNSRAWLTQTAPCKAPRAETGKHCDEYPFNSTREGGKLGYDSIDSVKYPKLKSRVVELITPFSNTSFGGSLGNFYKNCDVVAEENIVVPLVDAEPGDPVLSPSNGSPTAGPNSEFFVGTSPLTYTVWIC